MSGACFLGILAGRLIVDIYGGSIYELEIVGEDRNYVGIRRLRELGGGVLIDNLEGCCSSGVESGPIISKAVYVGTHGFIIQIADVCQFFYVFFLDGESERRCED